MNRFAGEMNYLTLCSAWIRFRSTFEKKLKNRESRMTTKQHSLTLDSGRLKLKTRKNYRKSSTMLKYRLKNRKHPTFWVCSILHSNSTIRQSLMENTQSSFRLRIAKFSSSKVIIQSTFSKPIKKTLTFSLLKLAKAFQWILFKASLTYIGFYEGYGWTVLFHWWVLAANILQIGRLRWRAGIFEHGVDINKL